MALVATINGKPVYSDKQMQSIINTRVQFNDGSWCDVATGDVHNAGSGFIKIGGTDVSSDSERITEGPKRFVATDLMIRELTGDVSVETHDSSDFEYTATGPSDQVKGLRVTVQRGTLVIEGTESSQSNDNVGGISINGGNIVIGGNSSVISSFSGRGNRSTTVITGNAGSGTSALKVSVKVPRGTPVTSDNVHGNVVVGDIYGPLVANVQGSRAVYAGRVTHAQLSLQGSGDIDIKEVNGSVLAQLQGSGDIVINDGTMPLLTAVLQGSGDIKVGGSAQVASLSLQGSGDIDVAHVQERPNKSVRGSGDIRVRRVG